MNEARSTCNNIPSKQNQRANAPVARAQNIIEMRESLPAQVTDLFDWNIQEEALVLHMLLRRPLGAKSFLAGNLARSQTQRTHQQQHRSRTTQESLVLARSSFSL